MIDDTTLDSIAERTFREADGDRSRAFWLACEHAGSDYSLLYKIDALVCEKFRAADNAARSLSG